MKLLYVTRSEDGQHGRDEAVIRSEEVDSAGPDFASSAREKCGRLAQKTCSIVKGNVQGRQYLKDTE